MKTIVFDLDGTLANIDHRAYYVRQDKPDWDKFYSACDKDTPNLWCVEMMHSFMDQGFVILIVSARRDTEKSKTLAWLRYHSVKYDDLIMLRKGNDNTEDKKLKREWLKSYGKENILLVVDDRQKVVDMWREEGLVCLQCYAWKEHE